MLTPLRVTTPKRETFTKTGPATITIAPERETFARSHKNNANKNDNKSHDSVREARRERQQQKQNISSNPTRAGGKTATSDNNENNKSALPQRIPCVRGSNMRPRAPQSPLKRRRPPQSASERPTTSRSARKRNKTFQSTPERPRTP